MKIKIVNENYDLGKDERLMPLPAWARVSEPWRVERANKIKHFRTHAAAIRWADKQARKGNK